VQKEAGIFFLKKQITYKGVWSWPLSIESERGRQDHPHFTPETESANVYTLTTGESARRCEATEREDLSNPLYISLDAHMAIESCILYSVLKNIFKRRLILIKRWTVAKRCV